MSAKNPQNTEKYVTDGKEMSNSTTLDQAQISSIVCLEEPSEVL